MGNCFGGGEQDDDDVTPLHDSGDPPSVPVPSTSSSAAPVPHHHVSQEPPPPYYHSGQHHGQGSSGDGEGLSEDEQMQLARKRGLLQHIPTETYMEGGKGDKECIICMVDFESGDEIRLLPCLHTYHVSCIDDWLLRCFSCPACMEPVDAALLSSYPTADISQISALGTSPATAGAPKSAQESASATEASG